MHKRTSGFSRGRGRKRRLNAHEKISKRGGRITAQLTNGGGNRIRQHFLTTEADRMGSAEGGTAQRLKDLPCEGLRSAARRKREKIPGKHAQRISGVEAKREKVDSHRPKGRGSREGRNGVGLGRAAGFLLPIQLVSGGARKASDGDERGSRWTRKVFIPPNGEKGESQRQEGGRGRTKKRVRYHRVKKSSKRRKPASRTQNSRDLMLRRRGEEKREKRGGKIFKE